MTNDAELWTWEKVGGVPLAALDEARVVVHWGVQIVAAAGSTLLTPRPDASHTALTWVPTTRAFASEPLSAGFRAALIVEGLRLCVLRADGTIVEAFSLNEQSIEDGLSFFQLALERATGKPIEKLVRPTHSLPAHSLGEGGLFPKGDQPGFVELSRWYGNAFEVLSDIAQTPGASALRCWPHHFDIATLIALDESKAATQGEARSIGVGFSPGEAGAPEPYWYVTPWPRPEIERLSPLTIGAWHRNGWLGAELTASAMTADTQARTVKAFLGEAITLSRASLEKP